MALFILGRRTNIDDRNGLRKTEKTAYFELFFHVFQVGTKVRFKLGELAYFTIFVLLKFKKNPPMLRLRWIKQIKWQTTNRQRKGSDRMMRNVSVTVTRLKRCVQL